MAKPYYRVLLLCMVTIWLAWPRGGSAEDLGNLSANPYGPNSTANPFGAGNPFSSNGVTNPFSPYGSPFSNRRRILLQRTPHGCTTNRGTIVAS